MTGMTHLARYLKHRGLSQSAFAGLINCSPSYLNELVKGSKRPGLALAVQIELATDGAVPVTSWTSHGSPTRRSQGRDRKGAK